MTYISMKLEAKHNRTCPDIKTWENVGIYQKKNLFDFQINYFFSDLFKTTKLD